VEQAIAEVEKCSTLEELKAKLQKIIETYGFSSFNFLDVGNPHMDVPFYFGTTGDVWEEDYKSNKFVHVDHCVQFARRSNLPFVWDEVPLRHYDSGPKPGALRLMEAAADHGFKNGLVVPFHYRDRLGRTYSSLCVFYWKDNLSRFRFMLLRKKLDLHLIVMFWVQRAVDLVAETRRSQKPLGSARSSYAEMPLTDRERDALAWAARGKTASETADIMLISEETVSTHLRNAMRKLGASNKTHAVVLSLSLGLIDI